MRSYFNGPLFNNFDVTVTHGEDQSEARSEDVVGLQKHEKKYGTTSDASSKNGNYSSHLTIELLLNHGTEDSASPNFNRPLSNKIDVTVSARDKQFDIPSSANDAEYDAGVEIREHEKKTSNVGMRKLTSTAINGTLISDTLHLTVTDSPYHIDGVLEIASGGTLVIDAGSTLVFQTSTSGINVNSGGQLLITGTIDKRVTLKPHEDGGTWNGIVFGSGSVPAVFDDNKNYVSGSVMQYVDIVRAGYSTWGSSIGLSFLEGAVPYLVGVHMTNCGGHYYGYALRIENLQAFAVMRNVKILQSNQTQSSHVPRYGIYINGDGVDAGQVILENLAVEADVRSRSLSTSYIQHASIAQSSFEDRVYIYSVGEAMVQKSTLMDDLILSNCQEVSVSKNWIDNGIFIYSISSSSPSFVIENSLGGTLHFSGDYYVSSNITVSGNFIEGSKERGMYIDNRRGHAVVTNNTVKDCSTSSSGVIELKSGSNSDLLAFVDNFVTGCVGQYIFKVIGSSSDAYDDDSSGMMDHISLFSKNTAFDNTATNSFLFFDEYPWSNFTLNIFDNNTAPLSVKLDMSSDFDQSFLPLSLNYWGSFQSDIVSDRNTVADGLIYSSQPIVAFLFVLSGPSSER